MLSFYPANVVAYGEILSPKARRGVITETETAVHSNLLNCFRGRLKWDIYSQILNTDRVCGRSTLGGLRREAEAEIVYQSGPKDIGQVNQKVL